MTTHHINLDSLFETKTFGRLLGELATGGEVYCLDGDLGAGKTTLTQAIAQGIQVPADYYVTSPSFNIFHEYPGRIPLYHMDFYRLGGADDVLDMGLDEYFYFSGLTVIEWASKAFDIIPDSSLWITLQVTGSQKRKAECRYSDPVWQDRLNLLIRKL